MKKIHNIVGFTLVEIIICISIIALLSSILIIALNPTNIFINARNSERQTDLKTISNSFEKYFIDKGVNGIQNDFSNLTGYSSMLNNATSSSPTSICPNAHNFNQVTNPFIISTGTGPNTLSIDSLVQSGYLPKVLKDPLSGNPYKACIDPCNLQQLVIFSDTIENVSDNLNLPLGSLGVPASSANIAYPCIVQSASVNMNLVNNTYSYCTGDTINITLPNSPVIGDLIIVSAWNYNRSYYNSSQISSVTDNMGNGNYSLAVNLGGASYPGGLGVWYKKIVNTGVNFTVSGIPQYANGQNCSMITVHEYKGLVNGTLDQTSSSYAGFGAGFCSGTLSSGSTGTTTQNTELLFSSNYYNTPGNGANSLIINSGPGYTSRQFTHLDNDSLSTQDNTSSQAGTFNATETTNESDCGYQLILATFK